MTPPSTVCVDASLGLKLVLPEPGHEEVLSLWAGWAERGVRIVSPYLFAFETASVIRNRVARRLLLPGDAAAALQELAGQEVELVHPEGLEREAYALATALDRPTAYDAFYLALGKLIGCTTYTADSRLHRAVHRRLRAIQLVGAG